MKVAGITLDDFRGIPHLDVKLDPQMTVIVGRNGLGKSSILDALAIMLFQVQSTWQRDKTRPMFPPGVIKAADKRFGQDDYKLRLNFTLEDAIGTETSLQLQMSLAEELFFRGERTSYETVRQFIQTQTFLSGKDTLLLYYRQDRGFDDSRRLTDTPSSLFGPLRALHHLETWWDKRDAEEARRVRDVDRHYRDPQLEAVRDLIKEIDGFVGLEFASTAEPEGLYFKRDDGARIHVSSLSTGERSFIILLADLARRLQLARPEATLDQIPGIILIDEIELNLHPSWQSKIIETLSRVFKSCQFVVTTHSPQVISAVESKHVRMLTRDGVDVIVTQPLRTKGQTSNYLLEGVFESHERFPEIDQLIDAFNAAIDAKDEVGATALLSVILSSIEGDPPELLVLRKRLRGLQRTT